MTILSTTVTLQRDDLEIEVNITGHYIPHRCASRFAPEEGGTVEDIAAKVRGISVGGVALKFTERPDLLLTRAEQDLAERALRDATGN